ncbi:unnamed protein product [Acanthoscelides obtectus]|uniref:Uncharacterized protein n=1 Tax=Acanthoscelides obtectus TaxID=200917 RepID=A0A9P0JNL1_ACAOB|nr:unnamed protein product [Acanthoscelides obtectus]CAK1678671.1 hypothetical protein AOBTE_LOCUS31990 [Acanthoscelides obtectus]
MSIAQSRRYQIGLLSIHRNSPYRYIRFFSSFFLCSPKYTRTFDISNLFRDIPDIIRHYSDISVTAVSNFKFHVVIYSHLRLKLIPAEYLC